MEQILTQPCKIPTNYFAVGGYSATFFNMGLVTLACLGLYLIFRAELNNVAWPLCSPWVSPPGASTF